MQDILSSLVSYSNIILIASGVILLLDIFEWKAGKEEWKWKLKLLAAIGFILGILDLIVVASGWSRGIMDTSRISFNISSHG
ncbi:MAG: hypothetical protein QW739_00340 [Candidatus Odinarchaeota archaeon]